MKPIAYISALALATSIVPSITALDAQKVPQIQTYRPFGTLREQADLQQKWLHTRMTTVLPALMKKYGVEMWVVPMREYNEDPVFSSIVSPTTISARRRTIYMFYDPCAGASSGCTKPFERLAMGGTSQGGVYTAIRSTKPASGPAGGKAEAQAELWGDDQWQVLKKEIEKRNPKSIAIDVSRVFAFNDGLSAGELEGMREALGPKWSAKFKHADDLALDMIATRLPEEADTYKSMQQVVWGIIDTAFSNVVVTPGVTRTEDVVWWLRQKVNDLGLGTPWFHPSVEVQRKGATDAQLGDNPIIQKGDVLHCDFGITAMRLNTDTQHMGYVLLDGETDAPAGLKKALANSNRLQDIVLGELKSGRTGNDILKTSKAKMAATGLDGTIYSHPIGMNGHGAGPLIGLWDYQDGVPGRGDAKVIPNQWFSIELQATTKVPEWNNQPVHSAQEEDAVVGPDGVARWALARQTKFHLVKRK
jgi:Xaa-Pro aminopeptidase